ncbi:two-component system regulatory protein YycI [Paenibacillus sp. CF384]|uniref:two-component system regulatory protein YycI n=1 Tax=Paenibacillus sp. CF384 TaxID=1884382 RepID=UPI00089A0F1F|nr:two-component system regulatory protein YycI [Paenibacillus sp. CF384]SDW99758.1 Two-component signal transduction system YycFG, regulatory protein YycI [Paenibacillus sp. CF384]
MDWGRAKSVLIFAFLLLNLVLGYQLWSNIREGLRTSADVSDLRPETQALMEEKKIKLGTSIPSETPELRDLTYRIQTKLGKAERHELKKPVDSKVVFEEKELQASLGGIIPELENYALGTVHEDEFILYRMVEGRPMFDAKLELYYDYRNQKITAYRQDLVELLPPQNSTSQSVLSATKVVTSLIENQLQNGAVIGEIKLGYHGQIFDSNTQVSAPTWRVLLEDGGQYYMNAISGEVVTE